MVHARLYFTKRRHAKAYLRGLKAKQAGGLINSLSHKMTRDLFNGYNVHAAYNIGELTD